MSPTPAARRARELAGDDPDIRIRPGLSLPLAVSVVMFDLDGTLLHTAPDLAEAGNRTLRDLGRPELPVETLTDFIGKGIDNLVRRSLEASPGQPVDHAEAMRIFRRHYDEVNGNHSEVFPGMTEGLTSLKERGFRLACVTNKAADYTEPLLDATGVRHWFELVISGDTLPHKKPHPLPLLHICEAFGVTPDKALLVGDSINDVAAARAAGCPVFCVPYGYNEGQDVRALDCDAIVTRIDVAARNLVLA